MGTEIFGSVTIRPPQQIAADSTTSVIDLGPGKSTLADSLGKLRTSGEVSKMVGVAVKFTASAGVTGVRLEPWSCGLRVLRLISAAGFRAAVTDRY